MAGMIGLRRLLIVGDSLAGGPPHLCYPHLVAERLSDWWVRWVSLPGKTLRILGEALADSLPLYQPDVVVFQGGGNDLLIPYLARVLQRGGNLPAPEEEFGDIFRALVKASLSFSRETLILSVPCLGEDLDTRLNARRRLYNGVLESVAGELGTRVLRIDLAQEREILERGRMSRYLMDDFSGFFLDPLRSLTRRGAMRLSEKRGLHLTIDGVHPNPRGAGLLAQLLLEALEGGG
ncbi:MAG: SGNH/GDSL hydrolase family protein [Candidatus Geothermincolales bacterium]